MHDPVVLVLRGSLLLRHWFGSSARTPADLDLECFVRRPEGRGDRFPSLLDHGRGLCAFAAENSAARDIEFDETDVPEDGHSLWDYGTPGARSYLGWHWRSRGQSGRLQIDIAAAGSYALNEIGIADVSLTTCDGYAFRFPAYEPEMMLAAKLSWLVRGLSRRTDGTLAWTGQPKDLFDVHLLLTKRDLRTDLLQKSLAAVCAEDGFDGRNLEVLFEPQWRSMADGDFGNWEEFQAQLPAPMATGPAVMLRTIAERLVPLLGYGTEEMPFLHTINSGPVDEFSFLVYADWLEERGDARGSFLRLFSKLHFHEDELRPSELLATRQALQTSIDEVSPVWLQQLFGNASRSHLIQRCIQGSTSLSPLGYWLRRWIT